MMKIYDRHQMIEYRYTWGRTGFDRGIDQSEASRVFALGYTLKNWGTKDKRKQ